MIDCGCQDRSNFFLFLASDLFNIPHSSPPPSKSPFPPVLPVLPAFACLYLFGLFKHAIHKSDHTHNGLIYAFKISIMAWGLLYAYLVSGSCQALRFDFRSYYVVRQQHDLHRSPLYITMDCVQIQLQIACTSPCAKKSVDLLMFNPSILT